jgi:hypothetical protein
MIMSDFEELIDVRRTAADFSIALVAAAASLDPNGQRRHLQEYPTGSLQDFSWGPKGRADYVGAED